MARKFGAAIFTKACWVHAFSERNYRIGSTAQRARLPLMNVNKQLGGKVTSSPPKHVEKMANLVLDLFAVGHRTGDFLAH